MRLLLRCTGIAIEGEEFVVPLYLSSIHMIDKKADKMPGTTVLHGSNNTRSPKSEANNCILAPPCVLFTTRYFDPSRR